MLSMSSFRLKLAMLLNELLDDMSSRVGLERGDRDIGEPSEEDVDMDDIPEDATDVFLDASLFIIGIMEKGPDCCCPDFC